MSNLKLTIDLLPKGAWGNNLRERLKKEDWDTLRNLCYQRFNHCCAICGTTDHELDAHEVWEFGIEAKTQTLKDIVPLCSACHGVKHMRNSERIGYGKQSRAHFLKVNKCSQMVFAKHYTEAALKFEQLSEVLRWKLVADLSKFGGQEMKLKERNIPFIENQYKDVNWTRVNHIKVAMNRNEAAGAILALELKDACEILLLTYDELENIKSHKNAASYFTASKKIPDGEMPSSCPMPPQICEINVDNYEGTITIAADYANKIQWILGDEIIKTKYNISGRFNNKFSVEN